MNITRIKKIFIANRGEIALRIIRAAHKLNLSTVVPVIPSEVGQPFAIESDEIHILESNQLADSYMNPNKMLQLAKRYHCDAVHPGYGFMSENDDFARLITENNLVWIGPSAVTIQRMGNKIKAQKYAQSQGLPVIESWTGSPGKLENNKESYPYPVIIKASAGGGGKGMNVVGHKDELTKVLSTAQREAKSYFGNSEVYIERYLERPRHIEVQVFGDKHGNYVHLFERDCSIQRRHQKIIEEAGDIGISASLRMDITTASVNLARALQYLGAGTIEYLVDEHENFYFLEMNTRIQVEHPVTEEAIGVDLVTEQIRVAMGYPLSFSQSDIKLNGHAIECRIYAEDPVNNFVPSPGKVLLHQHDASARVETGFGNAFEVSPSFDPMISKLITRGENREEAIKKMVSALENYHLLGISNNVAYLKSILLSKRFTREKPNTAFCEVNQMNLLDHMDKESNKYLFPAAVGFLLNNFLPPNPEQKRDPSVSDIWNSIGYWRVMSRFEMLVNKVEFKFHTIKISARELHFEWDGEKYQMAYSVDSRRKYIFNINGQEFTTTIAVRDNNKECAGLKGYLFEAEYPHRLPTKSLQEYKNQRLSIGETNGFVYSPLNGKAIQVMVTTGDKVSRGDILLIIESMKMENKIVADHDGIISDMEVKEGDLVNGKQLLLRVE